MLAIRTEYLDSGWCGREHAPVVIAAQTICSANQSLFGLLFEVELAPVFAILQSSIGLDIIGDQILAVPVVDVKSFLVWAQRNTIWPVDVIGDPN